MKEYGFKKDLFIKLDDSTLEEVSKEFLVDIEKQFFNFNEQYKKNYEEWKKYLNNKDFVFLPEKLSKKSPLTLINAPWGTGKTFFIENFAKLFIDKKLKSTIFKKIIIIDSWKFSNSKDVPIEFAMELSNKILDLQNEIISDVVKTNAKQKILNWIIPDSLTWKLGFKFFSLEGIHTNKNLEEKSAEELDAQNDQTELVWQNIKENLDPTIIFIDNLERLGSSSWDLLKAILKIQEFSNYLIVLPLNINKLSHNTPVDNSEYPIEKYVDFNYYDLQQDYLNFFNKYYSNNNLIERLNAIFNTEVNGKKLSIREVENFFKTKELFNIKDEYEVLKIIREDNFWFPKETFNDLLKKDAKYFLEEERKRFQIFLEVADSISKKDDSYNEFINISKLDSNLDNDNNVFDFKTDQRRDYKSNFNYLNDFELLKKSIQHKKDENQGVIKNLSKRINDFITQKNTKIKRKEKLDIELVEVRKQIEIAKAKEENYDSKKIATLQLQEKALVEKITELQSDLQKIDLELNSTNNKLDYMEANNNIFFDIDSSINKLKAINKEDKLSEEYKAEIKSILSNSILSSNSYYRSIEAYIENQREMDLSRISF